MISHKKFYDNLDGYIREIEKVKTRGLTTFYFNDRNNKDIQEYEGKQYGIYFLGSDLEEYPYYLLSSQEMTDIEDFDWLKDYIDREFGEDVEIDDKIIDDADKMCWLHFSDCMNNGGTSQLFIDFSPAPGGTKGQIVRFLHDPDELAVIAESFDEYLQMLMEDAYCFIHNDDYDD